MPQHPTGSTDRPAARRWSLVTRHGLALLFVAEHPGTTLHEIASGLGLATAGVRRIVRDLCKAQLLTATSEGRRLRYAARLDRDHR